MNAKEIPVEPKNIVQPLVFVKLQIMQQYVVTHFKEGEYFMPDKFPALSKMHAC